MVLRTFIQFPIFTPPNPSHRNCTEIRFSRWNNANAEKFIRHERTQKEIEDDLRFLKRFNSAQKIATIHNPAFPAPVTADTFRSTGTPSAPSRPSIPGKASKYSRPPQPPQDPSNSHPAFRPVLKRQSIPVAAEKHEPEVKVTEEGVVYEMPDAPFAYQYSYTETPKVRPLKLREPAIAPFEPSTMSRPWTGRKPLPPSKKKMEFDSFQLPPPHKKGVKPVQSPGPFLPGSGPKYVLSKEEILGEPLTKDEVDDLIRGCIKSTRQLNMGRDGLTHNMLDNIHAHWKRKRVCKIKCKGVCTVDMDNVKQQLEARTGGKIIYSKGGVLYLFRGRNYNYRTRPRFPIMLWKPVTPVYPRLIRRVPEGLKLEEVNDMRQKGRKLTPICKLAKNGVYCNLVRDVKEAFQACELVRINCQGLNASDYKKIGAKLKDLVPCVLISFEQEHILMWRGRNWKSSLPEFETNVKSADTSAGNGVLLLTGEFETQVPSATTNILVKDSHTSDLYISDTTLGVEYAHDDAMDQSSDLGIKDHLFEVGGISSISADASTERDIRKDEVCSSPEDWTSNGYRVLNEQIPSKMKLDGSGIGHEHKAATIMDSEAMQEHVSGCCNGSEHQCKESVISAKQSDISENVKNVSEQSDSSLRSEKIVLLWRQAIESGNAIVLDDSYLDADAVYERAVSFAKSAPPRPVFKYQLKKTSYKKCEEESEDSELKQVAIIQDKRKPERNGLKTHKLKEFKEDNTSVAQGSLRVDELAKLLA